jgi:hypothetical protein
LRHAVPPTIPYIRSTARGAAATGSFEEEAEIITICGASVTTGSLIQAASRYRIMARGRISLVSVQRVGMSWGLDPTPCIFRETAHHRHHSFCHVAVTIQRAFLD